jgi:Heparinase II/III-like protein/Heparinase II/III N-terminus
MTGLAAKAKTLRALGLGNVARVGLYRMGVRSGLHPARRLAADVPRGPFFAPPSKSPVEAKPVTAWKLFGRWPLSLGDVPPPWHRNPITGVDFQGADRAWWEIADFDPAFGDIKTIWDLSRMDWALAFAQAARNGGPQALDRLNRWLADWLTHNPPYRGPNWKCGQETSIRVMHLAMAALIMGGLHGMTEGMRGLLVLHLQRVAATLSYAKAQDNNHGTSEAAALFIGGAWLAATGYAQGTAWRETGRRALEERVGHLIGARGTFSQYSLTYQRVMLDTLAMAEVARRHLGLPAFSESFLARARAATQWLHHMIDATSGDGPNVGANDGARLLPLMDAGVRDFRPSLQLAMALFEGLNAGHDTAPLTWLDVPVPEKLSPPPQSYIADDGGFAMLRQGKAFALLRYPRFSFRPSQADALHLDLLHDDVNLLRDGGSFSYMADADTMGYFAGTRGHNTIEFDGRDQMPRLGRFLFGDWLTTKTVTPLAGGVFAASYEDRQGAGHERKITLTDDSLTVADRVWGFAEKAILRWRLLPGEWRIQSQSKKEVTLRRKDGGFELTISCSSQLRRSELTTGFESLYYAEKTDVPVIEAEAGEACSFTTRVRWAA